jgi:protoporphyrinogen oxidase
VTVLVVNLWYPNPRLLSVQGFGYLIPRTIPYEQNPEHALGVIFASESSPGQDTVPGTKLTVMFGGHWWDGWKAFPTEEEGVQMAKSLLARHLEIFENPVRTSVRLQENCIPQYLVGHRERLQFMHDCLSRFGGRLRAAGSWYHGVGLNDCIRAGVERASDIAEAIQDKKEKKDLTGLESVVRDPEYVLVRKDNSVVPMDEYLEQQIHIS